MPLYEFKCRDCEEVFEVRQEWKAPFPPCPQCGSGEVKKVLHAAALVFKGSGWHVNDYAKSGARSSNGNGKAASESNGTSSSSSSSTSSAGSSSDSSSSATTTSSSTEKSSKPDK